VDQILFYALLIGGGLLVGGVAGAVWALRQPDPNQKKKTSAQDTGESQQQEV
jgi:hypothetical protein